MEFNTDETLEGLRLTVFLNPERETVHTVEVRVDGVWTEARVFAGSTATGDVLELL